MALVSSSSDNGSSSVSIPHWAAIDHVLHHYHLVELDLIGRRGGGLNGKELRRGRLHGLCISHGGEMYRKEVAWSPS
jgi:hypothetical protein